MVVSELIEWLKTQDQDAVVNVVVSTKWCVTEAVEFEPEYSKYVDLRNHSLAKAVHKVDSYLLLGTLRFEEV